MIAANKNDILDAVLYLYFRRLARRAFHTIAGRGLERLRNLPKDRPVLLFCTHTNWWDGLIAFLLSDDAGFMTGQTISISGGLTMS